MPRGRQPVVLSIVGTKKVLREVAKVRRHVEPKASKNTAQGALLVS